MRLSKGQDITLRHDFRWLYYCMIHLIIVKIVQVIFIENNNLNWISEILNNSIYNYSLAIFLLLVTSYRHTHVQMVILCQKTVLKYGFSKKCDIKNQIVRVGTERCAIDKYVFNGQRSPPTNIYPKIIIR